MEQRTFLSITTKLSELLLGNDSPQIASLLSTWLFVMIIAVLACFFVSEITRNYSQVDKLWSVMPVIYCLIVLGEIPKSPRLWIMAVLVMVWGFRLSYNFYRKGGYNWVIWRGEEDYRWNFLRKHTILTSHWKHSVFNLLFISFYQHLLILLFTTPILLAAYYANKPLNWFDLVAGFSMLLFIIIETIADNQQFRFQKLKKEGEKNSFKYRKSLEKSYLHEGIWKYSRHPNFAAEQMIWVSFYFFSVAASGYWLNLTGLGAVLLILLFIGSSTLTENISKSKYPAYTEYQQTVARFIPGLKWRFSKRN